MAKNQNTVLVVLMNSKSDFEIAQKFNWYRIPVISAPPIVKNNSAKYISFYHTKIFEKEKYSIKWYAEIKKITIVKRKELFPNLSFDNKSENNYYKIEFGNLIALPKEILSLRPRRLLFIQTTEEKFFIAREINHLFNDSPLEDILWEKFVEKQITAERQFYTSINESYFILDFAVFCKIRNIDIECDGDKFHMDPLMIRMDKHRNNLLESSGWSVLRFTTQDILYNFKKSYNIINDTINK